MWRRSASELTLIKVSRGEAEGREFFMQVSFAVPSPGVIAWTSKGVHGEYFGRAGKEWVQRVSGHMHEWMYFYSQHCGRMSEVNRDMRLCACTLCVGGLQVSSDTGGLTLQH